MFAAKEFAMHLTEFQAWFEGFTEEMKSPPNKAQWAKIKKRVSEINEGYTPAPIFIDRYVAPWRPYWDKPYCGALSNSTGAPTLKDWTSAGRAEMRGT